MFLPNRDLFYNTDTKRLHRGVFDTNGALDSPGPELGKFTFNLVQKTYPFSWVIQYLPGGTVFYPVQMFPTFNTTTDVIGILNRHFLGTNFGFVGNTENPREIKEQVNIQAFDKKTGQMIEQFSPGDIAVQIMMNGETYAMDLVAAAFKQALGE